MPGKKGKLTDYLDGLPEGSRVERLPTQIFEKKPEYEFEIGEATPFIGFGKGEMTESPTAMRDELFANRAAARKIAKRDALFQARDADRKRIETDEFRSQPSDVQHAKAWTYQGEGASPDVALDPMQELGARTFNRLNERKPTAPTISPNRIPYTEAEGFRTGVPKYRTITRSDGRKVVIPNYGERMKQMAEEEQPGVLDEVFSFLRD